MIDRDHPDGQWRAILLTGPSAPEDLPAGVRAFPYLPYSTVFPRAAAVVHQAGIGTLAQAMRAGRPQLILPVAFDQPDNARRAAALGLGRVLPFKKATAQRLASELAALLGRPSYACQARAVAEALTKAGEPPARSARGRRGDRLAALNGRPTRPRQKGLLSRLALTSLPLK